MPEPNLDAEGAERRDEGRASVRLKVDYERLNTFFADYTRNVSSGGTFIRTTKPLEVGTRFSLALNLPDAHLPEVGATSLALTGEVRWVVREADAAPDEPAGMGVQFVFANDDERRRIEDRIEKLMRSSLGDHLAERLLARR